MDIGANAGIYTAFCGANGAHVTAYEPHPVLFPMLSSMVEHTGLTDCVEAVNAAVWTYTGECPFIRHISPNSDCTRYNGGVPTDRVPWTADDLQKATPTKCVSLDDAIGGTPLELVTIDSEDGQISIFRGT